MVAQHRSDGKLHLQPTSWLNGFSLPVWLVSQIPFFPRCWPNAMLCWLGRLPCACVRLELQEKWPIYASDSLLEHGHWTLGLDVRRAGLVPVHVLGCPICEQQFFSQSPHAKRQIEKSVNDFAALFCYVLFFISPPFCVFLFWFFSDGLIQVRVHSHTVHTVHTLLDRTV